MCSISDDEAKNGTTQHKMVGQVVMPGTAHMFSRMWANGRQRIRRMKAIAMSSQGNTGASEMCSEPTCTVVRDAEGYELRLYDPFVCVCTDYEARGEGIEVLAEYMDGKNDQSVRYPSSQPLLMAHHVDRKVMKLFVASTKTVDVSTLPSSSRPDVRLDLEGGYLVAATLFHGHATKERVEEEYHALVRRLEADGLSTAHDDDQERYHVAQYGPIFSLKPRKNELWVRVQL